MSKVPALPEPVLNQISPLLSTKDILRFSGTCAEAEARVSSQSFRFTAVKQKDVCRQLWKWTTRDIMDLSILQKVEAYFTFLSKHGPNVKEVFVPQACICALFLRYRLNIANDTWMQIPDDIRRQLKSYILPIRKLKSLRVKTPYFAAEWLIHYFSSKSPEIEEFAIELTQSGFRNPVNFVCFGKKYVYDVMTTNGGSTTLSHFLNYLPDAWASLRSIEIQVGWGECSKLAESCLSNAIRRCAPLQKIKLRGALLLSTIGDLLSDDNVTANLVELSVLPWKVAYWMTDPEPLANICICQNLRFLELDFDELGIQAELEVTQSLAKLAALTHLHIIGMSLHTTSCSALASASFCLEKLALTEIALNNLDAKAELRHFLESQAASLKVVVIDYDDYHYYDDNYDHDIGTAELMGRPFILAKIVERMPLLVYAYLSVCDGYMIHDFGLPLATSLIVLGQNIYFMQEHAAVDIMASGGGLALLRKMLPEEDACCILRACEREGVETR